jgi:phospholipid/cholesterol/gamma-HCH transport system substrate-binding protein
VRRITAVLLVAIAMATAAAVIGAPAQSAGTYRVDAIFDTAKGIIPGQVIKVAGARVGSIEDVQLTEDYKARIVMSVPRRFTFREDASCNIQPEGLISENFVQCDPGTPDKPELDGEPVPTVPVERTSVPVSITDLFRIFQADVRQRFTVAMMAVGGGLAARGSDVNAIILRSNPTLAAVRRLTSDLAAQREQISAAVRDTDELIAKLAERKDKVTDFIEQSERVTAQTAAKRAPLAESIRRLPPLLDATDVAVGDLNRLLRDGRPLLGELRAAAPGLEQVLIEVGPFSRAARPALTALGDVAETGRSTVRSAEPVVALLRKFTTVSGPAGRTLADLLVDLRDAGGVEYLARFIYFSTAATSRYDSTSHILPAHAVDGGQCSMVATEPVEGCNAFFRDAAPSARTEPTRRRAPRGDKPKAAEPAATPTPPSSGPAPLPVNPLPSAIPSPAVPTVPPEVLKPLNDLDKKLPAAPNAVKDLTDFLLGP